MKGLKTLINPESVAIVGASGTEGKVGNTILSNLVKDGFRGTVVPVNSRGEKIMGLVSYRSLAEYGRSVHLAIMAVPKDMVLDAAKDAVRVGVEFMIVLAAGFRESGEYGAHLESELVELCRNYGVRLLGPNCLGIINTALNLNASFATQLPVYGGLSVFSQSGALITSMLDLAAERHLGINKLISVGNKADVTEIDLLRYFAEDHQTKVVIGYLEDIADGDNFVKAAEEVSAVKPVVILKSGITEAGLKAAASHTGVLATADTAYGAAFTRSGVVKADTFEALFDYATALALQPLPQGKRVFIVTNAGGPGTMAADAVEKAGLEVARLGCENPEEVAADFSLEVPVSNPVDVVGDGEPEQYINALEAAQNDPGVDAVLVILAPHYMKQPADVAIAIAHHMDGSKPVVATFLGGNSIMPGRSILSASGLPDYDSPERAVAALKVMYEYNLWKNRPPRLVKRFRVNKRRVERIITRKQRTDRLVVGEMKGKDILSAYGFRIPDGSLAASAEEAIEIAERIGYPVAMKIVSLNIIHKSDFGGVQLNVMDPESVEDAYDLMMLKIKKRAPEAVIEGIYVEQMIGKGLELIIGMNRDPQFGPMLMFGLGGIFVEVMKDVTFHLAPITEAEAVQMLKSTRSYAMLEGRRGQKGVDIQAIASGLQRISQLTTDFPQILELDINPFIVRDFGLDPIVADVHMRLASV